MINFDEQNSRCTSLNEEIHLLFSRVYNRYYNASPTDGPNSMPISADLVSMLNEDYVSVGCMVSYVYSHG